MSTTIKQGNYKDMPAITMKNDGLRVQFLPEHGGKMASFVLRQTGREFLVQASGAEYKPLAYDGCYVDAECSGFDDMFPTIDRSSYPDYPWKGIEIPDHGEVCGLPWAYEMDADELRMNVNGVRFPYRLEKRIRFTGDLALRIDYRAVNLSGFDMHFLWAAHPMINTERDGELFVPYQGSRQVRTMFSSDLRFGRGGELSAWPLPSGADGGYSYKYYFQEKVPEGQCLYRYHSDGTTLKLTFPEQEVPYLGIWVNESGFKGYRNVAFEMCTGSMDRPDRAIAAGQNSVLPAYGSFSWYLQFEVE